MPSNLGQSNLSNILNQIYLGVIFTLSPVFYPFFQNSEKLIEKYLKKKLKKLKKNKLQVFFWGKSDWERHYYVLYGRTIGMLNHTFNTNLFYPNQSTNSLNNKSKHLE
jgi:hypothetical protein